MPKDRETWHDHYWLNSKAEVKTPLIVGNTDSESRRSGSQPEDREPKGRGSTIVDLLEAPVSKEFKGNSLHLPRTFWTS